MNNQRELTTNKSNTTRDIITGASAAFIFIADLFVDNQFSLLGIYLLPLIFWSWNHRALNNLGFALFLSLLWAVPRFTTTEDAVKLLFTWNLLMRLIVFSAIAIVMSKYREFYDKSKLIEIDFLTGAYNRYGFYNSVFKRYQKNQKKNSSTVLAYIDVDNFKFINDNFGHEAGDLFLIRLVRNIRSAIRKEDSITRMGGDEFMIFLPDISSENIKPIFDRIFLNLNKEYKAMQNVTLSAAVARVQGKIKNIDELIKTVDSRMYKIKKSSKNKFVIFDADSQAETHVRKI